MIIIGFNNGAKIEFFNRLNAQIIAYCCVVGYYMGTFGVAMAQCGGARFIIDIPLQQTAGKK